MRTILTTLLLLLIAPVYSGEQLYMATEHQSKWTVSSSPLLCALRHDIPLYGTASFSQQAGSGLGFSLHLQKKPLKSARARLSSVPPAWRHSGLEKDLGEAEFRTKNESLNFPEAMSRRLLVELSDGMFPTFTYADWIDGRDEVKVALSAVNVRSALGEFVECLGGLLPYDFGYVRSSKLYFRFNSDQLTQRAKLRLDELARYILADENVSQIRVGGHADSKGFRSYNKSLAQRRAESVREYLVAKGVTSRLFKIDSYGEEKPAATNRTQKGRSLNRRVMINLVR